MTRSTTKLRTNEKCLSPERKENSGDGNDESVENKNISGSGLRPRAKDHFDDHDDNDNAVVYSPSMLESQKREKERLNDSHCEKAIEFDEPFNVLTPRDSRCRLQRMFPR